MEDVGGVWGYSDLLKAIVDPNHEDLDEMEVWIGGRFNSEQFSVQKVNRKLRKV